MSDKPIDAALSPTYRRTPTTPGPSKKKKASRCKRLTSESLQSLYDPSDKLNSEPYQYENEKCVEDDCPESDRIFNSNKLANR